MKWLRREGDYKAAGNLCNMYADGIGVIEDDSLNRYWFHKSIELSNKEDEKNNHSSLKFYDDPEYGKDCKVIDFSKRPIKEKIMKSIYKISFYFVLISWFLVT